ncbi:MAG: hypothetical protein IM574_12650, partial [Cytophagales bacterium]|nr:hypothetical protein [Cytophagales bacterium]
NKTTPLKSGNVDINESAVAENKLAGCVRFGWHALQSDPRAAIITNELTRRFIIFGF